VTTTTVGDAQPLRAGFSYWWRSYLMMTRWELTGLRLLLPITVFVQVVIGAGFVLGIGLLYKDMPPRAALFLSTGVAVMTLVTVGIAMGPQLIAQQKASNTYDFLWSLPIPRTTAAMAWLTMNSIIAIPGMVVALLVAEMRYDIVLSINPGVIVAVVLTALTGTMLGYAMAHAVTNPNVTQLLSQFLIFFVLGFSPINYPLENLPAWLAEVSRVLPFHHMGVIVRGGLTEGLVDGVAGSYLVVALWGIGAVALAGWVLGRRK
jgi:ABC-2 type transport system permease protein